MTKKERIFDMAETPTSFNNLKKAELVEAAEYFGSDAEGTADAIRAALLEDGVSWNDYVKVFITKEPPADDTNVITSKEVTDITETPVVAEQEVVVAAEPDVFTPTEKYLVKMVRSNPYFEFGNYKFTQENPYAIMTADDAQEILSREEGFRQAFPKELQEFYS